jgi:hypothetical protein
MFNNKPVYEFLEKKLLPTLEDIEHHLYSLATRGEGSDAREHRGEERTHNARKVLWVNKIEAHRDAIVAEEEAIKVSRKAEEDAIDARRIAVGKAPGMWYRRGEKKKPINKKTMKKKSMKKRSMKKKPMKKKPMKKKPMKKKIYE